MKRLMAQMLILLLPILLVADEKKPEAKANALTPQEARDGWLLLFDGDTTFGWQVEGEAKVEEGVLILGGNKPTEVTLSTRLCSCKLKLRSKSEGKRVVRVTVSGEKIRGNGRDHNIDMQINSSLALPLVRFSIPADTTLKLYEARLLPTGMSPLFNGKNLDGWKVFEGKGTKSKYTVTKEGWLNVKDGPGDLQTTKTFDDFVLQLECISNGDRLNSGVFFRCIPGEYQQGYEAQVHNGWTDTPKKTYTIDEYDPKTHKLLTKKKVPSKAMDYGTGAIYRRMPARFGVAKDREWFTMTVVARERHIATWVNGIQVVDWTDNRPDSDNPRNGCRLEAGHISIQGHDPTTDLSFRNIRIAELK